MSTNYNEIISQLQQQLATQTQETSSCSALKNQLQQQQQTTNQLNTLLNQSMQSLSCGPDCQKRETQQQLEQAYINAKNNIQTAPAELQAAKKKYVLSTQGQSGYNAMIEEDLTAEADTLVKAITQQFELLLERANTFNVYYNSSLINSKHTLELYNEYVEENETVEKKIRHSHSDILTNDRRSYYEIQNYDGLSGWYSFFRIFYYILAVAYIANLFLNNHSMGVVLKIGISLGLFLYPFWIHPVASILFNPFKNLFTKNR